MFGRRKRILKANSQIRRWKDKNAWVWIEIAAGERKIVRRWT